MKWNIVEMITSTLTKKLELDFWKIESSHVDRKGYRHLCKKQILMPDFVQGILF